MARSKRVLIRRRREGTSMPQSIWSEQGDSSMNATLASEPVSRLKQPTSVSNTKREAWIASAPKQPMRLEVVNLGGLSAEDVEIVVEHCGLCHSDLSVLNNEWGISQYPAILGHEAIGRVTAFGPTTEGM